MPDQVNDELARSLAREIATALREHIAICTTNERAFREWQIQLNRTIDRIETDMREGREDIRVAVNDGREEIEGRLNKQQEINSAMIVRTTAAETSIALWRSDQNLMRISLSSNAALFTALIAMLLKFAKVV